MFREPTNNESNQLVTTFNLLGRTIKMQSEQTDKGFTLILGAGCSISSSKSDLTTSGILRKELEEIEQKKIRRDELDIDIYKRFVNYWDRTGEEQRRLSISKHFDEVKPSIGYQKIRQLVNEKYINNIITTNFDLLIDEILDGLAYNLIVGNNAPEIVGSGKPVVDLIKVHGDLRKSGLKFSPSELHKLPEKLSDLVSVKTVGPTLVIGYSGQDIGLMQSLYRSSTDYNVFWSSLERPDPYNSYQNEMIYDWMQSRRSNNNFLFGSTYGNFDSLMTELVDYLCVYQEKNDNTKKSGWEKTTIFRTIKLNERLKNIFLLLIEQSKKIANNRNWISRFPHYSSNYSELLNAYLHFFKEEKLPNSILQVPSNEVDALLIGLSIEILVRSYGDNILPIKFIDHLRAEFENSGTKYKLDESFWRVLGEITSFSSNNKKQESKVRISLNDGDRLHLEIDKIPVSLLSELLSTVTVLSLSIPITNIAKPNSYTVELRLLFQEKAERIDLKNDSLIINLQPLSYSEFKSIIEKYIVEIPGFTGKWTNNSVFESKWIKIITTLKEDKTKEEQNEYKFEQDIFGKIRELSEWRIKSYFEISSFFEISAKYSVRLDVDNIISDFLEKDKPALFIIGSSGSGKSTSIRSILNNENIKKCYIPIVVTPKSTSFQNYGVNLFLEEAIGRINDKNKLKDRLLNIDLIFKERSKKLILILDGLNEISGTEQHLSNHYLHLLELSEIITNNRFENIRIVVTCRDSSFANLTTNHKLPSSKAFYSIKTADTRIEPYYRVRELSKDNQAALIRLYFKNNYLADAFIDLIESDKTLARKFMHPYLIAILGVTINKIDDLNGLKSASTVFGKFAETMLKSIGKEVDKLMALKILYLFFEEQYSESMILRDVSRFKMIDQLHYSEREAGIRVLSLLEDVNIINTSANSKIGYVDFTHDRIAEYFLGKYILEGGASDQFLENIAQLVKLSAIASGGIRSYFNNVLSEIPKYSKIQKSEFWKKLNYLVYYDNENILKIFSESLIESENYREIIDEFTDDIIQNSFLGYFLRGLIILVNNNIPVELKTVTEYLLSEKNRTRFDKNNLAEIYWIASKAYLAISDLDQALNLLVRAKKFSKRDSKKYLLDKIEIQIAVILREQGKKVLAKKRIYKVYENQILNGAQQRAAETALELGMILRDETKFDDALNIYNYLWKNPDLLNEKTIARLNLQTATIYKNLIQNASRPYQNDFDEVNLDVKNQIQILHENFLKHNTEAIGWSEINNETELLLDALIEKVECYLIIEKLSLKYQAEIAIYIKKIEEVLSYFPIANRRIDLQRMYAIMKENNNKFDEAIKHVKIGKKIALQYNLAYKNCDCDYHLGFLILRNIANYPKSRYLQMALRAFDDAIAYYEGNVSPNNKYLENVRTGRKKLLQKSDSLKLKINKVSNNCAGSLI